jgi:hypothetical protein
MERSLCVILITYYKLIINIVMIIIIIIVIHLIPLLKIMVPTVMVENFATHFLLFWKFLLRFTAWRSSPRMKAVDVLFSSSTQMLG